MNEENLKNDEDTDVRRYSKRETKARQWLPFNSLICMHDDDDQTLKKYGKENKVPLEKPLRTPKLKHSTKCDAEIGFPGSRKKDGYMSSLLLRKREANVEPPNIIKTILISSVMKETISMKAASV